MRVQAMVIHKLAKQIGGPAILTKRDALLVVDERAVGFVREIRDAYYRSGVYHGSFRTDLLTLPFQELATRYIRRELSFVQFSQTAMDHLKVLIQSATLATGSYVVFSHFLCSDDFLSVVLLNDKQGYAIDDALNLRAAIHLETDKIHVAGSLNLTRWQKEESPYLSFVRGSREIAKYFQTFMGCADLTPARETSKRLQLAVTDYLHQVGSDVEARDRLRSQLYEHCHDRIRQQQPIYLPTVAAILNPADPLHFAQFASGERYRLSQSFAGHGPTLRALKFVTFRSPELSVTFDHRLFGTKVVYEARDNSLTIRNIPQEFRDQLPLVPSKPENTQ